MQMPLVSIVVPVYKAEGTLERCVRSILSQTMPDFELILVEDGSPDGCGALCDVLARQDARIRVIHKENGGASSARNAGLDTAAGRYLCFVDADDLIAPHLLEAVLDAAMHNPGDLVLWNYADERADLHEGAVTASPTTFPPAAIGRLYISARLGAVWAVLFETGLLKESGLHFDETLEMGEDLVFVFHYARLLFSGRPDSVFRFVETPLYYYDNEGKTESLSRRMPPDFCTCWSRVFEAVLEDNRAFFHMSEPDEYAILHNYMRTVGVGLYALLTAPGVSRRRRRANALAVLNEPAIRQLTRLFFERHYFSPYAWPFRLKWLWAIRRIGRWNETGGLSLYYKYYWVGYAIHRRLHPGSPAPV